MIPFALLKVRKAKLSFKRNLPTMQFLQKIDKIEYVKKNDDCRKIKALFN